MSLVEERINMKDIFIASLIFIYYMGCFWIIGTVLLEKMHMYVSLPLSLIVGCFLYYLCFNLVGLFMKLQFASLTQLMIVWFCFVIVVLAVLAWRYNVVLKKSLFDCVKKVKEKPMLFGGIIVLVVIQYIYIGSQSAVIYGVTDDLYYIGDVVRSVYTNTIQQYNYMNGEQYGYLDGSRILQLYTMHSAIICRLTGLHPLIENKWVLTGFWLILADGIYYLWGRLLFKADDKKVVYLIGIITWVVFTQKMVTESLSQHLVYRMAEGKNILGNIIIPFMFYLFARIVKEKGGKENWMLLFLTVTTSYCIVMSSMFILPLVLGSFYSSYILLGRRWRMLLPAIICFLPCVVVLGMYILTSKGLLSFPIP